MHLLHDLKGRQGLAKTHLGIPQHILTAALELADGLFNRLFLLRAEFYLFVDGDHFVRPNGESTFFGSVDGGNSCLHTTLEPFLALTFLTEIVAFDTGTKEDFMDLLIVEGCDITPVDGQCQFCVSKSIVDTGSLRILVYPLSCSCVEGLAVGLQGGISGLVQGRLTNLYAATVSFISNGEDVYQFGLECRVVLHV